MRGVLRLLYHVLAFATAARVVVVGWSMHPTLLSGEGVLFNRLAYLRHGPKRGDVVLVRGPQEDGRAMIKRVVGVPGDTVQVIRGLVMVNGTADERAHSPETPERREQGLWSLGEDEYFLLGDARDVSTDSRSFGPVVRKDIRARAWLVYWPPRRWRELDQE